MSEYNMPSPLDHNVLLRPTMCRLCGHEFKGASLATATIIGEDPQARVKQIQGLISPMMTHLQKKHPQQLQWAQMMGGEWAGLLSLNFFQCDEPPILKSRDEARWKIHYMTTRVAITDERIEERIRLAVSSALKELAHDEDDVNQAIEECMNSNVTQAILQTVRDMRDVLQEKDRYRAPKIPAMDGERGTPLRTEAPETAPKV